MDLKRFVGPVGVALACALLAGGVTTAPIATAQAKKARRAKTKTKTEEKPKVEEKPKSELEEMEEDSADEADKAEKVEEAQEKAEERQAPARFQWTSRGGEGGKADMDERADMKRDEAILKLKKILPTIPDGPQKAELIFRLSEMYWSKSKFRHLVAMQTWDAQLDEWSKTGSRGEQPKLEAIPALDEANLFKRQALKLYEQILAEYPTYPRKDEVLYNLGSSLYEAGKKKEGVKRYWELIKQYPDSDYAADAWLELGEHFFNSNKLTHAVKAYGKAAETKKPRIYSFALYKLAWCDYNLGEYADALDKFRKVIAYSQAQKQDAGDFAGRDRIQLVEESLNDMVRTYSHLDAVDDAFEYYTTAVGEEKSYGYLRRLGQLYNKEGKYALEVRTFQELNNRYPYSPHAPENQTAIMNAFAQAGKPDKVRAEVRRLVDLYAPNGTWAKKNAGNEAVLTKAFEIVEAELASLVTAQHREAQETKLTDTYMLARDIYKEYLDKFPTGLNAYDFRFFYSEILFELKEFEPAAEQYDLVVKADDKGKFARHAAYAAVLTWEKVAAGVKEEVGKKIEVKAGKQKGDLKKLEQLQTLTKGEKYEETPLEKYEQKLADSCDAFVVVAPKDDEVVKVKFKSARLYYIHNQFEEAATRFGEIIERWPKDSLARVSAESIVQSFNVREDWSNLNAWSRKFRGNDLLMGDKTFAKKINEFVEGASFNEIHFVFEPKEQPQSIADRYVGFTEEFPKSKFAMVGLYNAVVNYDKANLLERSIATAGRILSDYKDFKITAEDKEVSEKEGAKLPEPEDIREKALFLQASFHERIAQFETSANLYEQYATEFKAGPKRADALFNAGLFREGLGEFDTAIANFNLYIKDYPKKDDVPQIAWRIGLIHEKKKDWKAAAKHFGSYRLRDDPGRELCAQYKVIQANEKAGEGDTKKSDVTASYAPLIEAYKKLPDEAKQQPCPLLAVAHAAFVMLEPRYEAYEAIPLAGVKDKDMAQNLLKKLEQVEELQTAYTQVLQIGQGDYGIAALYRIGVIYQHLANAIFGTECPRRLSEDQCMIYQAALQEKAFPLEEKAIEAYDKALAKAYELGLYNEWLAKAQEAMRGYEPLRFPDLHEYDLIASEATVEPPALVELSK